MSCLLLAVAALLLPGGPLRLPGRNRRVAPGVAGIHPQGRRLGGTDGGAAGWTAAAGRRMVDHATDAGSPRRWGWAAALLVVGLSVPILPLAGPVVLLAAAVVLITAGLLIRRAVADRRRRRALIDVVAALRMLGRELRAGADPGSAADRAMAGARGEAADVLTAMVRLARGGDRSVRGSAGLVAGAPGADPVVVAVSRLTAGWRLSSRHGVAWAPLVDSLAQDLAEQLTAQEQLAGHVAGPRTSGYVMAALPILGLALGAGMGAAPVHVLLGSLLGNILLLVGVALICLGLLWAARIVGP